MENKVITIDSLIEQGTEILQGIKYIPPSPHVIRTYSVHGLADESIYERWKNITIRFLNSNYPNDISVADFRNAAEKFEKGYYPPTEMKSMIGILESIKAIPSKIEISSQRKGPSIVINNKNSQTQNQTITIQLFTKAIENELTISQIKELKSIVDEEKGDVEKAKPKIVDKLKSFGESLSSNIVANILTNPTFWSSIF